MSLSSFPKRLVLYQFALCLSLLLLSGTFSLLLAQSDSSCCHNMPITITPVSAADSCCLLVSATPSCFVGSVEVEAGKFGNWVYLSTSNFSQDSATKTLSFQICVTPGYNALRLHLKDASGNLICTKDIIHSCRTEDCCSAVLIFGNSSQGSNRIDSCCISIFGYMLKECPAAATWNIEQLMNGQWNPVTSASVGIELGDRLEWETCLWRTDGPFTFQVVLKDILGNVICSKELSYDCNDHGCCQKFDFQIIPRTSNDPAQCCFTLQGTESTSCNFSSEYTLEEFVDGQWQNIMGGSYQSFPLPNKTFMVDVCRPDGTHRFRALLLADQAGPPQVFCVKEATYHCIVECCSTISATLASIIPTSNCCSLSVDLDLGSCYAFLTCQVEYLVAGQWTNANSFVALQQTFSYTDCIPFGTTKVRFVFSDNNGVLCTREIDVACSNPCCDQLDIMLSPQLPVAGQCCFDIWLTIPSCLSSGTFTISEMDWRGGWHVTKPSTPYGAPTTYWIPNHCLRYDASPARIRVDFYGFGGVLLCSREITFDCHYSDTGNPEGVSPSGKLGAPTPFGEQQMGIVQNISYAPNPATDETVLSYALSTEAPVQIELVNTLGKRELVQNATQQLQGLHTLPIKTSHLSAGMYTLIIKAGNQQISTSLIVAK